MFQPFYRSPKARAAGAPGYGIGLSLIARVVWAHHGSVELLPTNQGTHLQVRLLPWTGEG